MMSASLPTDHLTSPLTPPSLPADVWLDEACNL